MHIMEYQLGGNDGMMVRSDMMGGQLYRVPSRKSSNISGQWIVVIDPAIM